MKKIVSCFLIILFVLSATVTNASTKVTYPNGQSTLYSGQASYLVWEGEDEGVSSYTIYLVGGKLGNTGSRLLGEVSSSKKYFNFIVPEDIKPGKGYVIQMSGKYASGDESEKFSIKEDKKKITLETMNSGVIQKGGGNIIKWKGGRNAVQIGVLNGSNDEVLGWIALDKKPSGQIEWNGEQVCDLTMTVCQYLNTFGATKYKIIVVSKDAHGNMSINGNSDRSDYPLTYNTAYNSQATSNASRIQYLRAEINRLQQELNLLIGQ